MRQKSYGFTLVEIAIVLAITGVILTGAILAGQAVLDRARIASLLSNVNDLAAASRNFKARFNYFPGDLPNAANYIPSIPTSDPCNYVVSGAVGNGLVDTAVESDCALTHLVKAGMLSKLDFDNVNNKYVITSNIGPGIFILLGSITTTNENVIKISALPCEIALEVDRKLDAASAAVPPTPFLEGTVLAHGLVTVTTGGVTTSNADAPISTCTPGGGSFLHDPVETLIIKY